MPIVDNINVKPKRKTHVMLLLDETGSMAGIAKETVDGVNEYINGLKKDQGDEVLFTLAKFDNTHYTQLYKQAPVESVKLLEYSDYRPGAMTNLYDSIGKMIVTANEDIADATLCTIMTDGYENASHEFNQDSIKKLIKQKESQAKPWVFTFLGADIDAYKVAGDMGIARGSTVSYGKFNTGETMSVMASSQGRFRASNAAGSVIRPSGLYTDEEKARMEKKEDKKDK